MLNIKYTDNYYSIIKLSDHKDTPYKIFGCKLYYYFIYNNYLIIINCDKNDNPIIGINPHMCKIMYDEKYKAEYDHLNIHDILSHFKELSDELELLKKSMDIDIICNNVILNTAKEFQNIFTKNKNNVNIFCIDNLDKYDIKRDNYIFFMTPQHYFNQNNLNNLEHIIKNSKCFIYFMEQTSSRNKDNPKKYTSQYNKLTNEIIKHSLLSFDYNKDNFKYLENIIYLPPPVIINNNQCDKIYDILFIGLVNDLTRRNPILENLKRFFKIKIVYDKNGDELTEIINQSKVVLNLHYYNENTLLEEVRLNEIINSDTHILSELPHIDVDNMKDKYKNRVNFINIINKPNKIIKKTDPIVVELKKLLNKPNKKYDHDFNNDLTENILIENIRRSIEEYKKYNEYPHLFHKYLLKIKNPNTEITYNIEKENKYKNFYVKNFAHLHCYDISKFHEIYDEYLDKIDKYFNIIITYSIGEIKDIDYTIIKIPNKGMDIGAKYCMIKYLNDKKLEYDYVMFLHSKSCPKTRKKYFQIVDDLNDNFIKNIHDYDSYFPDIKWEIIDGRLKMLSGNPEYENSNLPERNLLYRNELLKYLNCDNDTNIFTEGNVYILKNNIINKLFTDKYLYNILNEPNDFDYNWITYRYGIKGDIKQVYDEFKLKRLKPEDEKSYDGYIEHVFERIIMNLCEIKENEVNLIGLKNINVSIKDNLFLFKNYLNKLNNNTKINIYDISEINKINHRIKTIFCIQPYEITNIISKLSYFHKPEVLWVWEFKSLPQIFKDYEKYFSKVYTQSQFCYDVFSKHLSIPIQKVELNSMIFEYIDKISSHKIVNKKINNILENTKKKIIYGFCFDLNSSILRKNPLNLVKAFNNLNDETKVLILKYRPPRSNKFINNIENDIYNSFITEVKKNKNIYCITDELESLDLYKLYTNFDYYISPHCGEGFGFTIYDNMVLGNKIISPYYSGETDYLNREEIIELEYDEKEIPGLRKHPVYGQMINFKGAYISVESIERGLNNEIFNYKDYILYFVHLTCTQDFNTGIQKVVRTLSVNLNKKKKVILIKFNEIKNDYQVINEDELQLFTKYDGINHYDGGYNFEILSSIYNYIKNEKNMLIIAELLSHRSKNLFTQTMKLAKDRNYNISCIYHDDTPYYNTSIKDIEKREYFFNEYIKTLSFSNNIFPNSRYSGYTYKFHKNRLGINFVQNIKPIQLGVINSVKELKLLDTINLESNLIVSNISKTERKNYKNLTEAFKLLHTLYPNIKLIIFGHGWENKMDIDNNIEYKSFVSDNEKDLLFNNCKFSIYPSLMEGYGIPIYESLRKARCVICHNETSTLEISNDINKPCVSAINCNDINCLFEEMKKFCNKEYLIKAQKSIANVKFKTYQEYGLDVYNYLYDIYTIDKMFFCEEILNSPDHVNRGVGAFTREIKRKFKNTTNIYDKECKTILFTCTPPTRNKKLKIWENTFNLLKEISSNTNHDKKIIILHDIIPHILKDLHKPESDYYEFFELVKNNFDVYICNSNSTKNDLHSYFGFDLNKMIVQYPELSNNFLKIDIKNINIHEKYNITKKYIIAPLGAAPRKNSENTIKNFIKWNNNNNYQLVLMYECNEHHKKKLLSNISTEHNENIIFTGYVPNDDYKYLIKNAEFTIFISLYEGFGYCVMESTYLGTPVLTSNVGSTKELGLLAPSEIVLCNPKDDNNIIDKMNYLIQNLNKHNCSEKVLFNKCYNIHNKRFNNKLINLNVDIKYFNDNIKTAKNINVFSEIIKSYQNSHGAILIIVPQFELVPFAIRVMNEFDKNKKKIVIYCAGVLNNIVINYFSSQENAIIYELQKNFIEFNQVLKLININNIKLDTFIAHNFFKSELMYSLFIKNMNLVNICCYADGSRNNSNAESSDQSTLDIHTILNQNNIPNTLYFFGFVHSKYINNTNNIKILKYDENIYPKINNNLQKYENIGLILTRYFGKGDYKFNRSVNIERVMIDQIYKLFDNSTNNHIKLDKRINLKTSELMQITKYTDFEDIISNSSNQLMETILLNNIEYCSNIKKIYCFDSSFPLLFQIPTLYNYLNKNATIYTGFSKEIFYPVATEKCINLLIQRTIELIINLNKLNLFDIYLKDKLINTNETFDQIKKYDDFLFVLKKK